MGDKFLGVGEVSLYLLGEFGVRGAQNGAISIEVSYMIGVLVYGRILVHIYRSKFTTDVAHAFVAL